MHKHVERHERDQYKVQPLGQLGLLQLHGEENGHDGDDVGQIATQPVQPVEQRAPLGTGMWPEVRSDRLKEAQHRRHYTENGVRIVHLRPASNFDKDDHESGHRQQPRKHHQEPVPLLKLRECVNLW